MSANGMASDDAAARRDGVTVADVQPAEGAEVPHGQDDPARDHRNATADHVVTSHNNGYVDLTPSQDCVAAFDMDGPAVAFDQALADLAYALNLDASHVSALRARALAIAASQTTTDTARISAHHGPIATCPACTTSQEPTP